MSRTNEELVALIQNGATEYIPELWEQIVGLVKWKANRLMTTLDLCGSCRNSGIEFDDLCNAGFPALIEAVETYNPEGGAFTTWFMFYLKTAFAKLTGYRTEKRKREPLNNAVSLNTPLSDEADPGELADLVADPQATALMENADDALWRKQLHEALEAALSKLTDDQCQIMRAMFWDGTSRNDIATSMGITQEKVRSLEGKAIRTLRKPEHACKLIDFYDFSYYCGTGLTAFQNTGTSIQERFLLIKEENQTRARKHYASA